MARTFSGALVPAVNPDGSIQWQAWQYDELLQHLTNDLDLSTNSSVTQSNTVIRAFIDGRAASFGVIHGTNNFTVARTGVGRYTVTFVPAFNGYPVVVATGTGVPGSESVFTPTVNNAQCTVSINALPANVAADDIFSLMVSQV